jgi:hypothetical protein
MFRSLEIPLKAGFSSSSICSNSYEIDVIMVTMVIIVIYPQVKMYRLLYRSMDCEQEFGRTFWMCIRSKLFLLKGSYPTDMISGSARNVLMYIVPQCFGPVMKGGGVVGSIFLLKEAL